MQKFLTFLVMPLCIPFLLSFYFGKNKNLCHQDLTNTLKHRGNPFHNTFMQFVYFMIWLPEYRSVFYRRNKIVGYLFGMIFPKQKCLYIRTLSSQMGGGIVVNHGHSTEINAKSLGTNCVVFQNVTIGTNGSSKAPVIGDNCFFGAGCVVIGDITIGNNVKIGANAIVTKSIPDNCTVVTTGTMIVKQNGTKVKIKI